jgi:hypothetical protein
MLALHTKLVIMEHMLEGQLQALQTRAPLRNRAIILQKVVPRLGMSKIRALHPPLATKQGLLEGPSEALRLRAKLRTHAVVQDLD